MPGGVVHGGHLPHGRDQFTDPGGCRSVASHEDLGGLGGEEPRALLGGRGGGYPVGGFLREGALHDFAQFLGHTVQVGFPGHHTERDHVRGAGTEREPAGGGVGDERAPGEHVALRPGGAGAVVLGADPAGGAGHDARPGHARAVGGAGDPEVEDARAGWSEDDVLRLHVPVDDAGFVDGRQCLGRARREGVQGAAGQGAVVGQVLVESRARSVGGRQPGRVGFRVGGEQRHEARPLHARGQLHLAPEPGPELRVFGLCRVDHLDSDPEPVGGETGMDGPHAAGAKAADDPVRADTGRITWAGGVHPPAGTSSAHEESHPRKLTVKKM